MIDTLHNHLITYFHRKGGKLIKKEEKLVTGEITPLYKCGSCGKKFTMPIKMLDFSYEAPREVEICPYCDNILNKSS